MTYRKKLIEVALPLDAINIASAREKSIRHGHPSTLHLWWSRKPLATCRAVLFASLVDDPAEHLEEFPTEEAQEQERLRLFRLMEELVKWENSTNEDILAQARTEIHKSTGGHLPPALDPFAGGGSILLEAQRLGLEAHASDLNPVAVLITKALVEIPPKFVHRPPVNAESGQSLMGGNWHGACGLADDIRYYGKWMRDEAERRIGHLYPKVTLPKEYGGGEATVIAWLWVRTVICPNPACGVHMPLTSKWWLSKKKGKEAWVEPEIDHQAKTIKFEVCVGQPTSVQVKRIDAGSCVTNNQGKKTKAAFECTICKAGIARGDYIDEEANKGRMGVMPLAMVVEGKQGRVYLPIDDITQILEQANQYLFTSTVQDKIPMEPTRGTFASNAQGRIYGFKTFSDYFTPRQLVALITFCDLVHEAREKAFSDAVGIGMTADGLSLSNGGIGADAYADAVATYLALAIDRLADRNSTICSWDITRDSTRNTFARQAIPMIWDFVEANPMSESTGNFLGAVDWIAEVIAASTPNALGKAQQRDASTAINGVIQSLISTDPPYYDNVSYADLSDFFYVWLRRSLGNIYPDLFKTMLVPKAQELVATPYRFNGSKSRAQEFFETGLRHAFERMRAIQHSDYPLTVSSQFFGERKVSHVAKSVWF